MLAPQQYRVMQKSDEFDMMMHLLFLLKRCVLQCMWLLRQIGINHIHNMLISNRAFLTPNGYSNNKHNSRITRSHMKQVYSNREWSDIDSNTRTSSLINTYMMYQTSPENITSVYIINIDCPFIVTTITSSFH